MLDSGFNQGINGYKFFHSIRSLIGVGAVYTLEDITEFPYNYDMVDEALEQLCKISITI